MEDNKNLTEDEKIVKATHPERNDLSDEENVVQLVQPSAEDDEEIIR